MCIDVCVQNKFQNDIHGMLCISVCVLGGRDPTYQSHKNEEHRDRGTAAG